MFDLAPSWGKNRKCELKTCPPPFLFYGVLVSKLAGDCPYTKVKGKKDHLLNNYNNYHMLLLFGL